MDWPEFLKLTLVGLSSGLFSSFLAYRAHRQKKWWELRVAAYQEVIVALSDIVHYHSRHSKLYFENRELSDEQESVLVKFRDEGYPKVRRASDTGAFIFSDGVNDALNKFMQVSQNHDEDHREYTFGNLSGAEKCLKSIVDSSKKDLQTKWWWL